MVAPLTVGGRKTRDRIRPGRVHKAVVVRHRGMHARIDADIAPLVLETWKAGVRTHCSCQDAGAGPDGSRSAKGWIQLGFPSVAHARTWLRLVAKHRKGARTLYHRQTSSSVGRWRSQWRWDVSVYDAAYDWGRDETVGPATLDFRVFVYFPRADMAAVVRRLKESNRRRRPGRARGEVLS
jgi:hypothetical protein